MAARRPTTTPTFAGLGVPAPLIRVLEARGITEPFPIQAATLPDALSGRDLLGRGRTGSGKTYAFVLPTLIRLSASRSARQPGRPRALVLVPTRELATQVEAAMAPLAEVLGLRTLTVFGGVGANPQIAALRKGVDVLVACPGRLDDHVRAGHARLDAVEITVLDEADHMADLGFLPVVRRLLDTTPESGQRLLFSATLDSGVDVLVRRYLHKPVTHSVDPAAAPPPDMVHHVLHLRDEDRFPVLVELTAAPGRTVVFTRTKRGARTLTRKLVEAGVPAVELHGNLAQNARDRNLSAFSGGGARTLVATDIAARGIHVDDVGLVIHADPPAEHKAYLHRSGRTARAGAQGTVITLMTDRQAADVHQLTREAGIAPTITRTRPGDALLARLAPGERVYHLVPPTEAIPAADGRGERTRQGQRGPARAKQPKQRDERTATATATGTAAPRRRGAGAGTATAAASGTAGNGRSGGAGRSAANGRSATAGRSGAAGGRTTSTGRVSTAAASGTGTGATSGRPTGAASFSSQARVGGRRGGR
jgi:superfamily II DNA/RNA helicase